MAGVGLGAIAMEWIETESEIGKKRGYFEASKPENGPAEMSAAPPIFHQDVILAVYFGGLTGLYGASRLFAGHSGREALPILYHQ